MKSGFLMVSFGLVLGAFIDIDRAIELVTDNHQKQILSDFKRQFAPDGNLRVTSQGGQFEIIVSHPSQDNYTGGAEQYLLNKATGHYEMGWHEHPMPLDILSAD